MAKKVEGNYSRLPLERTQPCILTMVEICIVNYPSSLSQLEFCLTTEL